MLSILLASALALSLAACGGSQQPEENPAPAGDTPQQEQTEQAPKGDVDKITLTYVKSPLNVPSIVEKEKGIFTEAFGLPVEYSNLTTGPEQTQALASGDIQFLYAVGATSVILSASNGADIQIISMYSRSPEAFKLFANNEQIQSAADLKGMKVAGPKGTILHELLVAYLGTAGLKESDIQFINMGIPESQAALSAGEVDCALLAGPAAYNMEKSGARVLTTGKDLVDATIVVATSKAFMDSHPELVKTFLDAQKTVGEYMEANYDEVMDIAAKETELSVEAVKEMYPMYDFDMTIRESDIQAMQKTEQFLFDNQMIENHVNIQDIVAQVQ